MARPGAMRKRSLSIAGHRTSIALEPAFWTELDAIASHRGLSLAALVGEVDANRGAGNLASALRVYALEMVRGAPPDPASPGPEREALSSSPCRPAPSP